MRITIGVAAACLVFGTVLALAPADTQTEQEASAADNDGQEKGTEESVDADSRAVTEVKPEVTPIRAKPIAPFVEKGVDWLISAQHSSGGWGGGSHSAQQIRDPHKVVTDPGTTAFTLLTLLRAGHTPVEGKYQEQARRGLVYLLEAVESASDDGPLITDIKGTQPQTKLGQLVDTSLTAQYLARALGMLPQTDDLRERVDKALDKCVAKLQSSQKENGGWGEGGGWAPVLQSSLSCSALEIAKTNGKQVDPAVLDRARAYQKDQVAVTGGKAAARTTAAAGVELYAFNGAFRGNAADARAAVDTLKAAKQAGTVAEDAEVSEETLQAAGIEAGESRKLAQAAQQNEAQIARLDDENLLKGFGNNGGEEFLSYLMTSESLVIAGATSSTSGTTKCMVACKRFRMATVAGRVTTASPVPCFARPQSSNV